MKRGRLFIISLLLLFIIGFSFVITADEATQNIESRVLETFDPDDMTTEWLVQGSKFLTEENFKYKTVDGFPFALYGRAGEEGNHQVLGVTASFDRQGYNYLELIPVKDGDDGKVPNPIGIPGRVKELDLWVWGSNYKYTLEMHLMDYKGFVHVVDLGWLNFTGWKNLRVKIPNYIRQAVTTIPSFRQLLLLKFVVRTEPKEKVAGFDIYFDHIKVLTDVFQSRFDGDAFILERDEIWAGE